MVKQRIYPNYTENYTYDEAGEVIRLIRTVDGQAVNTDCITFDSEEEAQEYWYSL
jgi:hypothetical protein